MGCFLPCVVCAVKGCSDGEEMMETGSAHSFPAPIVASEAESSKVDHLTSAQLFTPDKVNTCTFIVQPPLSKLAGTRHVHLDHQEFD